MYIGFCFFKQKTAYEMRISDWSSDVCSSDLLQIPAEADRSRPGRLKDEPGRPIGRCHDRCGTRGGQCHDRLAKRGLGPGEADAALCRGSIHSPDSNRRLRGAETVSAWHRSEEHTSELQSLMRISYAVFCLKKKKHPNHQHQ